MAGYNKLHIHIWLIRKLKRTMLYLCDVVLDTCFFLKHGNTNLVLFTITIQSLLQELYNRNSKLGHYVPKICMCKSCLTNVTRYATKGSSSAKTKREIFLEPTIKDTKKSLKWKSDLALTIAPRFNWHISHSLPRC